MIEIKVKQLAWGIVIVVVIIVLCKPAFSTIADLLIDPGSAVPDNIPIPGK